MLATLQTNCVPFRQLDRGRPVNAGLGCELEVVSASEYAGQQVSSKFVLERHQSDASFPKMIVARAARRVTWGLAWSPAEAAGYGAEWMRACSFSGLQRVFMENLGALC